MSISIVLAMICPTLRILSTGMPLGVSQIHYILYGNRCLWNRSDLVPCQRDANVSAAPDDIVVADTHHQINTWRRNQRKPISLSPTHSFKESKRQCCFIKWKREKDKESLGLVSQQSSFYELEEEEHNHPMKHFQVHVWKLTRKSCSSRSMFLTSLSNGFISTWTCVLLERPSICWCPWNGSHLPGFYSQSHW